MKVKVLSYNISWATQKNIIAGSEQNFVKKCRDIQINCFKNTIKIINNITDLQLIGLQEVNTPNLEKNIIKNSIYLNTFERGTVGQSSVCIIWNKVIFGKLKKKKIINLDAKGERPCLIILTEKGYQLIVAHFPWISNKKELNQVYNLIIENCFSTNYITIIIADTNDAKTLINKKNPFKFGRFNLSQGLTKSELRKNLISCCWHEKGHKYQSFDSTGDYILAPSSIIINNYIPDLFIDMFASDHRPVIGILNLKENY